MAAELSLEALRDEIDGLDEVIVRLLDRRARCAYAVGRLKLSQGMGIAIISTSTGLLTDRQAQAKGVGGEVLAYVW